VVSATTRLNIFAPDDNSAFYFEGFSYFLAYIVLNMFFLDRREGNSQISMLVWEKWDENKRKLVAIWDIRNLLNKNNCSYV